MRNSAVMKGNFLTWHLNKKMLRRQKQAEKTNKNC